MMVKDKAYYNALTEQTLVFLSGCFFGIFSVIKDGMNDDQVFFDGVEQGEGEFSRYFSAEIVMATLTCFGKIKDLFNCGVNAKKKFQA